LINDLADMVLEPFGSKVAAGFDELRVVVVAGAAESCALRSPG